MNAMSLSRRTKSLLILGLLTLAAGVIAISTWNGDAEALDCPHCETGAAVGETGFSSGGDITKDACRKCHIGHNSTGTTLLNEAGIDNLCRSCHISVSVGTEVDPHMAVRAEANCDFCTYDFTTVCTDCHDPHGHQQPINAAGDPSGAEGADYLLRLSVKKTLPGVTCSEPCPAGESADGSPDGACVADPVCGSCVGNETCDDASGKAICTCPVNFDPADCSTCASGFSGGTCTTNDCSAKAVNDPCGHGSCVSSGGTPDCTVDCPGGQYNDPTDLGHCVPDETTPTCGTKATPVFYDGYKYCDCPVGYQAGNCNAGACRPGFTNSGGNCVVQCSTVDDPCGFGGTCITGGGGGTTPYSGTSAVGAGGTTSPTNALADDGADASVPTSTGSTLTVSGFPSSGGTIDTVTVYVKFRTSGAFDTSKASRTDSYELTYSHGSGSGSIFGPSSTAFGAYTTQSTVLSGLTWADIGSLAVQTVVTQAQGADGVNILVDHVYIDVTTSGGGVSCNGTCSIEYTGTDCDQCAAGYVPHDGACIPDPCTGNSCGSGPAGGSCFVDNGGSATCDCGGRYYGASCTLADTASCPTTGGVMSCECDPGYGLAGECDTCLAGYHEEDGNCVADSASTCTGIDCGSGTCVIDDNSTGAATYFCECSGRYYSSGGNCDACTATGGTTTVPFVLEAESGTNSYADGNATNLGICEACHTQTTHHNDSGTDLPSSHNAGTDCIDCHRHRAADNAAPYGFIPAPGQGTGTPTYCAGCHLSAPGAGNSGGFDVDSYQWNGTKAVIDYQEWVSVGHGLNTGTFLSGNSRPDFDAKGSDGADPEDPGQYASNGNVWLGEHGCSFCHDGSVSHNDPSNYYRLANVTGTAYAQNGPCLVCHGNLETGYLGQDSGLKIDFCEQGGTSVGSVAECCSGAWDGSKCTGNGSPIPWHYGSKHTGGASTGGQFCWDCHDPHGDVDDDSTPGDVLWYMFQAYPVEDSNASDMGTVFDADGDESNGLDGLADVDNDGIPEAVEFRNLGAPAGLDHAEYKTVDSAPGGIGICRVCHDNTSRFNSAEDDAGHPNEKGTTEQACTGCHTHNWGLTALTCVNCVPAPESCNDATQCHGATADVTDYWTGTKALIDMDADGWLGTGHGLSSASTYPSGNAGANFRALSQAAAGDETVECYYCHEPDLGGTYLNSHQAGTFPPGNRFMLANITGPADANDNCMVCHGTGSTGYNPPSHPNGDLPLKDSTLKVGTAHYPSGGHGAGPNDGGKYCWNCHDPHGDAQDYMFQDEVWVHNDATQNDLRPDQTITPQPATFDISLQGGAGLDWDDYRDSANAQANPICGACHTNAAGGAYALCRSGNCAAHNPGEPCTNCHPHNDDFQGAGDCTGCHGGVKGTRRAVGTDFGAGGSHHIKRTSPPFNKYDCVMCHLEGTSGAATDGTYHKDGDVDLRDADGNSNGSWQYTDDDSLAGDLSPNGLTVSCAAADGGNWKTAMTKYCLACHDANGFGDATFLSEVLTNEGADVAISPKPSRSALNPFGDANGGVTCTTSPRHGTDCSENGMTCDSSSTTCRIINVNDQFNPSNFATHSASCWQSSPGVWTSAFKDATGCPAADCGTSSEGYIDPVTFTNGWNTEGNFVTECVDCHMPGDTSGSLAGQPYSNNAHGAYNEPYLLDSSSATDVATVGTDGTSTTVCFRCHLQAHYMERNNASRFEPHSKGGSHTSAAYTVLGTETGIGCFACHGGYDDGDIHGEADTLEGSGTNAVIFLNGGSIKWWQVSAKSGPPTYSCGDGASGPYNLGCGNHDTSGGGQSYDRAY